MKESENQLKVSLMQCDGEREDLERKCAELEREREGLHHNVWYKSIQNTILNSSLICLILVINNTSKCTEFRTTVF